ncbi:glycosyltransferase family 4 protein [Candidatus Acetatifactor stercoripullorum]|uniref:glycosyltransferase family 4 protein n=1 Tax=Candidatus Acetatifactor stercoripullorum TaxID=2838414 RepID=UPI00298DFC6A|nr:glycosyltransferase family 4 protein [Candidatus Acetatifactor stercoripullorum]
MDKKRILIFHPDIYVHRTNNEYTKKMYAILEKKYEVKSLEWFIKHPFDRAVDCMYLNWYENIIGKPSVVAQNFQYMLKYAVLIWAKCRKIKIVYVVHNKTPHSIDMDSSVFRFAAKPFMNRVLNIADVIVELCKHTESYLQSAFKVKGLHDKMVLIPHGRYTKYKCDLALYRSKYSIKDSELLFCFVGKMDRYKNVDVIIKAFYMSKVCGKLLLAGKCDEHYKQVILDMVKDENIICDFGYVTDKDMSAIMQMAHAVVLPYDKTSINSGIMINAFSNGTTVIGTRIEMLFDFDESKVYGYSYAGKEDHIVALSKSMERAYNDFTSGRIKIKGCLLEKQILHENDWNSIESKMLETI